jgi:hypothetical protein
MSMPRAEVTMRTMTPHRIPKTTQSMMPNMMAVPVVLASVERMSSSRT